MTHTDPPELPNVDELEEIDDDTLNEPMALEELDELEAEDTFELPKIDDDKRSDS